MNKNQLSQKWSKYCDTDKLVDDIMTLLKEFGHKNTEKGVCSLLDTYFTNKEPLIKMFATSKNYIGDMRISLEKEFDRNINVNEIRVFLGNAAQKFHVDEMLKYEDDNGKSLFDYLHTGKTVFGIDELPNAKQQEEHIEKMNKFQYGTNATVQSHGNRNDFMRYVDFFYRLNSSTLPRDVQIHRNAPLLKSGTKTSRAFNKVCTHYGIDKLHPETVVAEDGTQKTKYPYDKLFAEYSDLVSDLTRKMQYVISLNPLDYLLMSNGVNWVSCHNIRTGGCMGGTIAYMLDNVSIVTFVVDKLEGEIHKIPKVYRQMYHYENNLFIQSRVYPQSNDGATNLYDKFRNFMIEEFTDLLGIEGEWKCKIDPYECTKHVKHGDGAQHYPDYVYNKNAGIFYPENNEPGIRKHVMTIGRMGICVNCGKEYNNHGRLTHDESRECRS